MSYRNAFQWTVFSFAMALASCADDTGTPCHYDYHCFSNSCTFGTCDSPLSVAIGDAIFGEEDQEISVWNDDSSHDAKTRPPSSQFECSDLKDEATCRQASGCRWLVHCGFEETCTVRLEKGLGCPWCNNLDCAAPCELLSRCLSVDSQQYRDWTSVWY